MAPSIHALRDANGKRTGTTDGKQKAVPVSLKESQVTKDLNYLDINKTIKN